MANVPPMRTVWRWRREILAGFRVKDIAQGSGKGYSEATIRRYTKAERAVVKERDKEFRERVETQKLLRMAHESEQEQRQREWEMGLLDHTKENFY